MLRYSLRIFQKERAFISFIFSNLAPGSYIIEVYQKPKNGSMLEEFWGSDKNIKVGTDATTIYDFYRHTPILWSTNFEISEGLSSNVIILGQTITPKVSVKNFDSYSVEVIVRVVIDEDRNPPYSYNATSSSATISPGGIYEFRLSPFRPTKTGTYHCYVVVYGKYGYRGDFIPTDQLIWSKAFNVTTLQNTITTIATITSIYTTTIVSLTTITITFPTTVTSLRTTTYTTTDAKVITTSLPITVTKTVTSIVPEYTLTITEKPLFSEEIIALAIAVLMIVTSSIIAYKLKK